MKKIFACFLTVFLVGAALSWAGGNQQAPSTSGKAPVTVDWFIAYDWVSPHWNPAYNEADKYVYDNTGVNINFSTGDAEKLNVLIATDSLPDIITYDAISSQRLSMEDNGMLYPLDDLMTQYGVTIQAPQGMKDWYRNEKDGKWYAWVSFFYDKDDTKARGGSLVTHNFNFAREDIMQQYGIDEKSLGTKDGFIAALEKVKSSGVTYKSQKVIPWFGSGVDQLAEQFGRDREDKNGNLLNSQRQPEYLEALLFLNEIYRRGLTTDEIFTSGGDPARVRQLVGTGQVFASVGLAFVQTGQRDLLNGDDVLLKSIGYMKGSAGKEPVLTPSSTAGWTGTMVSRKAKNPQRVAELLAFLTRPELSRAESYGGLYGYDIVNGEAVMKPERIAERAADPAAYENKYLSAFLSFITDFIYVQQIEPKTTTNRVDIAFNFFYRGDYSDRYYDDKIFSDVNPEGGSDLAGTAAQVSEYWEQQFPRIVMAGSAQEANTLYQGAIAQMDRMGMAQLDAYKNQRFQINKKRMGVQFAWPRNDPTWVYYGK
jgi:putative aldouronate transport system substrate-binding protein